jgi:glycosyltransferase involved in cell wall biosynthesis
VRILYLINGLNGGGAAFPIPSLVSVMRSAGHDVRVLAFMEQDGLAREPLEAAGIDYRIIGKNPSDIIGSTRNLINEIKTWKPDILWTSLTRATIFGQIAGRLCGVPVISWQHNAWLKPANLAILKRSWRMTGRWIVDSDAVGDYAAETIGIPRERISVWPIFMAEEQEPGVRVPDGRFVIGSLGRLHPNKRYDFLLDIVTHIRDRHPDVHEALTFIIAGEGPERPQLEEKARARGLDNVHFPGFRRDAGAFLGEIDAYIQPSRNEGMCLAAHEAMAAGLPVIASAVGQMRYTITPECGFLHDAGDVEGFANSILTLARDRALAQAMGAAAYRRVIDCFGEARFRAIGLELLASIESGLKDRSRMPTRAGA